MTRGNEIIRNEIIEQLTRWFADGPRSLEWFDVPIDDDGSFAGVLVYAKTQGSRHWTRKLALPADRFHFEHMPPLAKLPFSAQHRGWENAFLFGRASHLEDALRLMGLDETQSTAPTNRGILIER